MVPGVVPVPVVRAGFVPVLPKLTEMYQIPPRGGHPPRGGVSSRRVSGLAIMAEYNKKTLVNRHWSSGFGKTAEMCNYLLEVVLPRGGNSPKTSEFTGPGCRAVGLTARKHR